MNITTAKRSFTALGTNGEIPMWIFFCQRLMI